MLWASLAASCWSLTSKRCIIPLFHALFLLVIPLFLYLLVMQSRTRHQLIVRKPARLLIWFILIYCFWQPIKTSDCISLQAELRLNILGSLYVFFSCLTTRPPVCLSSFLTDFFHILEAKQIILIMFFLNIGSWFVLPDVTDGSLHRAICEDVLENSLNKRAAALKKKYCTGDWRGISLTSTNQINEPNNTGRERYQQS